MLNKGLVAGWKTALEHKTSFFYPSKLEVVNHPDLDALIFQLIKLVDGGLCNS